MASYDLAVVMQDILAVLDHFRVEKAILRGHDLGGAVIQQMVFLHPSRIAGLSIINSPILPTFNQLVNFDKEQQSLSQYTIQYHQYQARDPIDEEYIVRTIRDPARRRVVQEYLASSSINGMLNYYKKNYPSPPYGKKVDTSFVMYNIPTLIIWGLQDEYFSLKVLDNLPLYFRDTLRLVTLPSAGHWAFRDEYAKVNREISSWLEELKHV
jgi:pimeloyl-ACP methyl ester carboxylesterase